MIQNFKTEKHIMMCGTLMLVDTFIILLLFDAGA